MRTRARMGLGCMASARQSSQRYVSDILFALYSAYSLKLIINAVLHTTAPPEHHTS